MNTHFMTHFSQIVNHSEEQYPGPNLNCDLNFREIPRAWEPRLECSGDGKQTMSTKSPSTPLPTEPEQVCK